MPVNKENYQEILQQLGTKAMLVAVSKTKPVEDILELYQFGQRDFGENYVQELVDKEAQLPKDIRWHFIGHLQSNKVKYIAPFVHLIHGVDSLSLLKEINKQAAKCNRVIECLLQVHISGEATKFGFDENELTTLGDLQAFSNIKVAGLMGMASFSDDTHLVTAQFKSLKILYEKMGGLSVLSMGMSGDYQLALQEGSNMVRIGSLLFGQRNYPAE